MRIRVGAVAADGSFALSALPPGEQELEAVAQFWFRHSSGASGQTVVLAGARKKVVVEDGKTAQVALDLRAYAPATVEGIVTLDGQRPEAARVVLRGRSADGQWAAGQFVPDDKGRFVAAGLLPGTYTAELVVGDLRDNEGTKLSLPDVAIELEPGQRVLKELAFRRE